MAIADTKKSSAGGPKKHKSPRAYPSFYEMTSDAIVTLKERTGSSQYAIAKFIEEKHKKNQLPSNFKKLLLIQLKKFVASGKLVKVKNSYKLPPTRSSSPIANKPVKEAAVAPKPKAAKTEKPKAVKIGEAVKKKRKASTEAKAAKPKVAKSSAKATPGAKPKKKAVAAVAAKLKKKAVAVVAAKPKKKVAFAKAPKPKSVKSPGKKKAAPKKTSK